MGDGSLQTSFWFMVVVQTIGSIDMPGSGARKMPAPRQYVAILVAWIILQVAADTGPSGRRAATAIAWVLVLTGMVVGPFGKRLVSFLNTVGLEFSNAPPPAAPVTSAANAQQLGG
jgi:hypothetical protein